VSDPGDYVGVDVVDVDDGRCAGKDQDARFLRRILSGPELGLVERAHDPAQTLWRIWAAKEAAFKVVSKVRGAPPPFVHAAFEVEDTDPVTGFGCVRWEDVTIHIHWHVQPGRVVALGWNGIAADEPVEWGWGPQTALDPDPEAPTDGVLARLTERERGPVHSRPSALVRLAARAALAKALGVDESRVQIVSSDGPKGRVPPEVLLDGEPARADVSLSHHGRWLAWALRLAQPSAIARVQAAG
jgi:phosphopantetheinyl transferase (holo-ACP synthase)